MPSEGQSNLAWRHADVIASLPEPPETFTFGDTDLTMAELKKFKRNNLITHAADADSNRSHVWVCETDVYERAVAYLEDTDSFACCGARGVTNEGGDLKCIDCGAPISEAEYRRVVC